MLQVLHHQDQGGGGLALGDGADGLACLCQVRAATAQGFGHGQRDQAVFVQQLEVVMGKGAALVIQVGRGGQLRADVFEQGFELGHFDGSQGW
ncbi:hypothetical protein D3C87_1505910 [compost metagenome]